MKTKKMVVPLLATAAIMAVGFGSYTFVANADELGFERMKGVFGPREEMRAALENNDYEAYKDIVGEAASKVASKDTFNQMSERFAKHEIMRAAIEDGDYDAWKSAMEEQVSELQANINEETFAKLSEAHQLMRNGDRERAREVMKNLGLGGGIRGVGFARGMKE